MQPNLGEIIVCEPRLLKQYLGESRLDTPYVLSTFLLLLYYNGLVIWNKGTFSVSSVKPVHCLWEEVKKIPLKGIQWALSLGINSFFFFLYCWLCWVFISVRGLSLVAASNSSLWCAGLSLSQPLLLRSTGSRRAGSVVVAHGPSCSAACGIFPDQGVNPCPLHWQADSQPLRHQGSPRL